MASEKELVVAAIFRASGRQILRESEVYLPLAMEFEWCGVEEAKRFVNDAVSEGLLVPEDGFLRPGFDVDGVAIPPNFAPSAACLGKTESADAQCDGSSSSCDDDILVWICSSTGHTHEEMKKKIQQIADERHVVFGVAALVIAKKYNLPVTEWYERVEGSLFP